ncbi:sensor histidine kinase [Exilibacterium tricleocarpae]|uniref:sensor histidine kinase n=1 Tax=Exilibacterium tricleocarpae TaxID=2591008 RepID=UPI001FE53ED5|nr:sensor histidine kinase [Exilibacterium tricleocarpae]
MVALVLVGELLALALVVTDAGLQRFDWVQLGAVSFLVQWIVLSSAALLCPLRPFLRRQPPVLAGSLSYGLVLFIALVFLAAGQWMLAPGTETRWWGLLDGLLLAAIFAGIALRYFYLQQQLHNQQRSELEARIQALQSRIRPHFLFNSMNSIASLIETEPRVAEKVVEDLSDLFRASLAEPALVPVADELQLCRQYVRIEQLRLGPRLSLNWRIGEYPAGTLIPSLLVQPLLENAIYHGIQPRPEGGCIDVELSVRDHRLTLEVRNPLPAPGNSGRKTGNRVALENIRHRLVLHFGPSATCVAEPRDTLFITTISYPI